MSNAFFSREQAAGYKPEINASMKVLVAGAGALAQSVLTTLSMAQVGQIHLVDFDHWDDHNATRSPLFGSLEQRSEYQNLKAPCVAQQLVERTWWSDLPAIAYAVGRLQELGDRPFRDATIIISCVDDPGARADITAMCHRHNVPLIEGGFAGSAGSFAIYNNPAAACWQCGVPNAERARVPIGCQANAIDQARQGFIAMTQSLASIIGSYMAEAAIQLAHGNHKLVGNRVYCTDIRFPGTTIVKESRRKSCPSPHQAMNVPSLQLTTPADATFGELIAELAEHFDRPSIALRASYVARELCAGPLNDPSAECDKTVEVGLPDWALNRHPRCEECGGQHKQSVDTTTAIYPQIKETDCELLDLPCTTLGIAPSEWLLIEDFAGELHSAAMPDGKSAFTFLKPVTTQTT